MNAAIIEQARRIIGESESRGITTRVLGGVAVALRCPSAGEEPLARDYEDLDLITSSKQAHALAELLGELGFRGEDRFNRLHGHTRLLFDSPGCHIDVLVGRFTMCHELDLSARLTANEVTLSPADLLLTKLQVVNLNMKDIQDVVALLVDFKVDEQSDYGINGRYIGEIVGSDWGWWKTATGSLAHVGERLPRLDLDARRMDAAAARIGALEDIVAHAPRSLSWRLRARVGTRMPWYNDPEEVT
jgi:hypothetical protein